MIEILRKENISQNVPASFLGPDKSGIDCGYPVKTATQRFRMLELKTFLLLETDTEPEDVAKRSVGCGLWVLESNPIFNRFSW